MALPIEVVDHILSFLQSDQESLKACSQIHVISEIAERRLYSGITIVGDLPPEGGARAPNENYLRGHELGKLLSDKPNVARHVRHLKINLESEYRGRYIMKAHLERISPLLPLLSRLRKITISHVGNLTIHWQTMPEKSRPVILGLFHLPSMKEVHIEKLDLDDSLVKHCQAVRTLTLTRCGFYFTPDHAATSMSHPLPYTPLLRSLSVEEFNGRSLANVLAWVRPLELHALRILRPSVAVHQVLVLPRLISSCSSSLNSLDLDLGDNVRSRFKFSGNSREEQLEPLSTLDLSLPRLQQLTIRANIDFYEFDPRDDDNPTEMRFWTLSAPTRAVSQLVKASPCLKKLRLGLKFYFKGRIRLDNPFPPKAAEVVWFPLLRVATECRASSVKVFARVECRMDYRACPPDAILSLIAECPRLMRLVEQGVVVVRAKVSSDDGFGDDPDAAVLL